MGIRRGGVGATKELQGSMEDRFSVVIATLDRNSRTMERLTRRIGIATVVLTGLGVALALIEIFLQFAP